jgi:hypothetical protein
LIIYVVNENLNYMEIIIITCVEHIVINLYFYTHYFIFILQFIKLNLVFK